MSQSLVHGVLFDLDGTLLDTAPDFLYVLNTLRAYDKLPPLTRATIVPWISRGSAYMVLQGLPCPEEMLPKWHVRFLDLYAEILGQYAAPFEGIAPLLDNLDRIGLPWGIVTNKPQCFTIPLLQRLQWDTRAQCIISGDTLAVQKPDPAPVLAACTQLGITSTQIIYCGDALQDMIAGHKAGCRTVLAEFGYLDPADNISTWPITHRIATPIDFYPWLEGYLPRAT